MLDSHGLELTLLPRNERELIDGLRTEDVELALLVHRATSEDAVDSLGQTLERLGQHHDTVVHAGDEPRAAARRAEQAMLADARIVPLVRLDAWLALPHGLKGVSAGAYGVLRLEKARWRR